MAILSLFFRGEDFIIRIETSVSPNVRNGQLFSLIQICWKCYCSFILHSFFMFIFRASLLLMLLFLFSLLYNLFVVYLKRCHYPSGGPGHSGPQTGSSGCFHWLYPLRHHHTVLGVGTGCTEILNLGWLVQTNSVHTFQPIIS